MTALSIPAFDPAIELAAIVHDLRAERLRWRLAHERHAEYGRGFPSRQALGRIVHFASVSSLVANVNYAAYASSKAALSQLVRVLAREWAPSGVSINAIGPAMTETGMTAGYLSDPDFRKQALSAIPMGRFGTPEDLVGLLVLLLAPGGSFITGQTIFVDGGRTLV